MSDRSATVDRHVSPATLAPPRIGGDGGSADLAALSRLAATATIAARLFGDPRIFYRGRRIDDGCSADTIVFLAYVLTRADEVLDDRRISADLWPAASPADATALIRQHVARIEELCLDMVPFRHVDGTFYVERGLSIWSDAASFRSLASAGKIAEAIELQRDDFLRHHGHDWVVGERERLRDDLVSLVSRAARSAFLQADYRGALHFVEHLHRLEPSQEDVLRALVSLKSYLGDLAGAFATYRAFQARARTLGIEPSRATVRRFEAIQRGEIANRFGGPILEAMEERVTPAQRARPTNRRRIR